MNLIELFLIAIGLSMDAFAVAICKGISLKKANLKDALTVAFYFGVFQALMPLLGYLLAMRFAKYINALDHWVAFILLLLIGANMIRESFSQEEGTRDACLGIKKMLPLAIATSIDALAIGISFAFLKVNITSAIALIGSTTFVIAFFGVKAGCFLGEKFESKAELLGGIILIAIGIKILLDHTLLS